jgi:replicative DNA helicase
MLSDLKESGSIEESADCVVFLHRAERYDHTDLSLKGQADFIIAKQRNGPVGHKEMQWEGRYQRFVDPADRKQEEMGFVA